MDSFWDFFWFIISFFLLMAYLMVLFQIIGDLFRDKDTSGWLKAVWIFFLIFLPILTSLVYLIVSGREMTERNVHALPGGPAGPGGLHPVRSPAAAPRRPTRSRGPRACWTPGRSRPRSSSGSRPRRWPDAVRRVDDSLTGVPSRAGAGAWPMPEHRRVAVLDHAVRRARAAAWPVWCCAGKVPRGRRTPRARGAHRSATSPTSRSPTRASGCCASSGSACCSCLAGYEIEIEELIGRGGRRALWTWTASLGVALAVVALLGSTDAVDGEIAVAIALTSTALRDAAADPQGQRPARDAVRRHPDEPRRVRRARADRRDGGAAGRPRPGGVDGRARRLRGPGPAGAPLLRPAGARGLPDPARRSGRARTTSGQTQVRLVVLLLVTLGASAAAFDIDAVLGAFVAGIILRRLLPAGPRRPGGQAHRAGVRPGDPGLLHHLGNGDRPGGRGPGAGGAGAVRAADPAGPRRGRVHRDRGRLEPIRGERSTTARAWRWHCSGRRVCRSSWPSPRWRCRPTRCRPRTPRCSSPGERHGAALPAAGPAAHRARTSE